MLSPNSYFYRYNFHKYTAWDHAHLRELEIDVWRSQNIVIKNTSWVFKNNSTVIRISFNKVEQVEKFANNKQYKKTWGWRRTGVCTWRAEWLLLCAAVGPSSCPKLPPDLMVSRQRPAELDPAGSAGPPLPPWAHSKEEHRCLINSELSDVCMSSYTQIHHLTQNMTSSVIDLTHRQNKSLIKKKQSYKNKYC